MKRYRRLELKMEAWERGIIVYWRGGEKWCKCKWFQRVWVTVTIESGFNCLVVLVVLAVLAVLAVLRTTLSNAGDGQLIHACWTAYWAG
jgi:hypothetical protein